MEETQWICSVFLQNGLFHAVFDPINVSVVHAGDTRRNPYRSSCKVFCYLRPTLIKPATEAGYSKVLHYQTYLKCVPRSLRYFTCTERRAGKPNLNRYFAELQTHLTPCRNFILCMNVVGAYSTCYWGI